jgi:DNA (cytosine-5)-methyltransferase 1
VKFISICSGIEAASVAFKSLGWKAVAFAEIEPFPCAVLAHHYPNIPNFGDMTKFREWPESVFADADIIVGGPPCQAFSVAGLRKGLNDDRGNLTLTYAELINHADDIRTRHGKPPVIVLYENVPGLLSDKTGAFGSLLGALAGEDEAIDVKKWPRAGVVDGGRRRVAWCVLDAQWFGLAQRRRRVFVVAVCNELVSSLGDRADPAAILSIGSSLRRDTAPSREAGKVIAPTIRSGAPNGSPSHGQWSGDSRDELIVPITMAHGQGGAEIGFDRGPTLDTKPDSNAVLVPAQAIGWSKELTASVDLAGTIQRGGEGGRHDGVMIQAMQVRRLTPVECERLQGFSDGYTMIPWRNKPADQCPDGPRYKALGNSWAVPVVRWIGRRIHNAIAAVTKIEEAA